jgi:hypothetical protein
VHFAPLDWLAAACRGVCVIDLDKAAPLLRRAAPLQVISIEQAATLHKALAMRPKILIAIPTAADDARSAA